jgi:hypothetical protein
MGLTDVYRIFHSTSAQYTFFSAAHGTFSKIDHILRKSKPQQVQENRNNPLHSIQSQCTKTRTQQQKQQQKIHK